MNPLAGIVLVFSVLNIPHSVLGTLQPRPGNPLSSCTLKNSSERRYRNGTRSGVIQEMWSCTSIEALDDSAEEEETSSRLRRRGIVDIACSDWEYKLPAGQAIPDVGELADILASLGTEGLFTDPCPEPNEVVRFTKGGWSFTGENRDDNNRCNKLGTMGKFLEKLYDFCERDGGSAFGGGYGNDDVYPQLYSLFPSALAAEVGEEEKPG